ncbi:MAG: hypothetical protein KIS96_10690 [Bauldia sp.]|nr:hypothetical protein [Bauldia sp.]
MREPNGRAKRGSAADRAEDMRAVALEARARVFALAKETAAAMPETSVLGRLRATGEISARQYEAGALYREVVRAYDRMMMARGLPKAGDLERRPSFDGSDGADPDYRRAFDRAVRAFDECASALRTAAREDRLAPATVNAVAISDLSVPQFTPALRVGLNHLARALKVRG